MYMYSSAVFAGGRPLALKFYPDRVVPISHSWHQKTSDTRLPDGEDCIPLRSLVLTIPECDGQTDRQTCRRILYSACKASAVKTNDLIFLQSLILQ